MIYRHIMKLWVKKQQRKSHIIASLHHFYVEQGWPAIPKLEHKIYDDGKRFSRDHPMFEVTVFKDLSEYVHINHIRDLCEAI